MTGWIRHILSTEQKKTDFKPEDESAPLQMYSKVSTLFFRQCSRWGNSSGSYAVFTLK